MLHVWYIYLHNWVIIRANVGKYAIHGAYGIWFILLYDTQMTIVLIGFIDKLKNWGPTL